MHDRIADLEELVLKCHGKGTSTHLREAVACYQAGAMRAAILSTWIAVAFDFIDKISTLEAQGDALAKQFAEEFRKIRQSSDLRESLQFERQILDRAHTDLQLISNLEYADLKRLFEDRHRCAHPSMITDEELYQPTAEQVRYLMRSAVDSMLSQPPTSGKAALSQLLDQVRGNYFPFDKQNARIQLEVGYLRKPRPALVRNFAIVLLKIATDPAETVQTRARAIAALNALKAMHPIDSNAVLTEKFSDRLRPTTTKDENLLIALVAVSQIDDAAAFLELDVRDRLSNFVAAIPDEEFSGAAAAAMKVAFTKTAAIARTEALKSKDFAAVVGSTAEVTAVKPVRQRGIQIYAASRSFDGANSIAQSIILPMTQAFDREEIEEIVRVGFANAQIRFSHEFSVVLSSLKVNRNVDFSWWDPLLSAQNAEDFTYGFYFAPPPPQEGGAALGGFDGED